MKRNGESSPDGVPSVGGGEFRPSIWSERVAELTAADRETALEPDELERLAMAAYLLGRDADSADAWSRAYHEHLRRGDAERAACSAFWLGFSLGFRGGGAQASGWIARARRLVDENGGECVARGFVLIPEALRLLRDGESAAALAASSEVVRIGERHRNADLTTLGRLGQGQALVMQGRHAEGLALLDEVMVTVTDEEVLPFTVGLAYCAVIETCGDLFDLGRAREWTAALSRWCEAHPGLVPFRGQCLVRRAELLRLQGQWSEALDQAQRACDLLSEPPGQAAIGLALYEQAELHRLHGEFASAEQAYRQASRWDRRPRPGLPLLRLAQNQLDAAQAAIRRMLDETQDERLRPELLAACTEIMVAAGEVPAARVAAAELSTLAEGAEAPYLMALSARSTGAVLLAEGKARLALIALRDAWTSWQRLEVPYEAARTRVLIALACRALGDDDAAANEFDAARAAFAHLGARPDLARVERLTRQAPQNGASRLTARELQVLRLVATGKTNRAIAAELGISEKTVARHVSNLFTKLGLETRAAAAAYAYRHELM